MCGLEVTWLSWHWMPRIYTSPVSYCLCTSAATLPTYIHDRYNYMCTLTERYSIFHKTTRYSIVFLHMIPTYNSYNYTHNATVASNSLVLEHKHFQVHQLLALLKRCNRRVQPSYKQMLLWLVAIRIHKDHTHVRTHLRIAMTKYACTNVFTVYRHLANIRMYVSIYRRVHTWCASECTSDGSESEAHWIDPVHTVFFLNSWAMNALRTCYVTTSCDKMAYAVAVLLLFNCTWLRLKHERDRRRENMRLRRYTAVPGFIITQPQGLLPVWLTHETGSKANVHQNHLRRWFDVHWDAHRNKCASCVNARIRIECALQL